MLRPGHLPPPPPPWFLSLCASVATEHGFTLDELRGRRRTASLAMARNHLYAACRARGLSLPEIGRLTDRDHTTVMSGLRRWEERDRRAWARICGEAWAEEACEGGAVAVTDVQRRALELIAASNRRGMPRLISELAADLGVSRQRVAELVRALVAKGLVSTTPRDSRETSVLGAGWRLLQAQEVA